MNIPVLAKMDHVVLDANMHIDRRLGDEPAALSLGLQTIAVIICDPIP
jgi:hypothetical protein